MLVKYRNWSLCGVAFAVNVQGWKMSAYKNKFYSALHCGVHPSIGKFSGVKGMDGSYD